MSDRSQGQCVTIDDSLFWFFPTYQPIASKCLHENYASLKDTTNRNMITFSSTEEATSKVIVKDSSSGMLLIEGVVR